MSKNILIVESENDKYFIESLIRHISPAPIQVDTPICSIDDYECLDGLGNFSKRLTDLKKEIASKGIEKIGIILDADNDGIEKRIEFINARLSSLCSDVTFTQINKFIYSAELDVNIACCITHVDGFGELDTLLKTIKSKDSTYADCLESWKTCLDSAGKPISQKDFDKFWVSIYQRYDQCTIVEKKQAGRKCNNEASLKKPIWNFEHTALTDLKTFLQLF